MKIIDDNITFLPEMKYLCAKSCAYQVLDHMGITTPLSYIYTGCSPYICAYKEDFLASGKSLDICGRNSYIIQGKGHDFKETLELNRQQIKFGNIPIVLVDTYFLPYRAEFKKNHGCHTVILSEIKEDRVEIIDWYDTVLFKGEVLLQDYKRARTSKCNDRSNPFALIPIENDWMYIDASKITQDMKKSIMYENISMLAFDLQPNNKFEKTGIHCLRFLEDIISCGRCKTEYEKSVIMKKLHDALFPYLCTSKLMKKYLQQVIEINSDYKLIDYLDKRIELLQNINYNSLRASIAYREDNYHKVQCYISKLISEYSFIQNEACYLLKSISLHNND